MTLSFSSPTTSSGNAIQPVERLADVFVLKPGCVELAAQRAVVGIAVGLIVVFEQVNEDIEHFFARGPQLMRWYTPPGRLSTFPSSSSVSSIADMASAVKPVRWIRVSIVHGSYPIYCSRPSRT